MQQEQRLILKMLEEGKITAEEAEALLNAIGDSSTRVEPGPQEDPWVRLEKMGEDFATKVEDATERFARSLEHKTEGFGERINKVFAKFPFIGVESSQEFTQVIQGKVEGSGDVIPIDLDNFNGSIRVEGWLEEGYRLTVVQRLRGKDRDLLRSRVFDLDWVDGASRDSFELVVPALDEGSVSLHLLVPQDRVYEVRLNSYNGSLAIDNLAATTIAAETVNGSTQLRNVHGKLIQGQNSNGSCEMSGVEAESIRHRINNGSYRLSVTAQSVDCLAINGSMHVRVPKIQGDSSLKLRTTNGSIRVGLPTEPDLGVALDLSTSVGRVSTEVGPLEMARQERTGGGNVLVGRSMDFERKPTKLNVGASTTSGSITVGSLTEKN